jgi:ABC-type polysaccharide/polyol phosphate export permease
VPRPSSPAAVAGWQPRASEAIHVRAPATRRVRPREVFTTLPAAKAVAMRAFKARFKQAALGPVWLVGQPLAIIAVFTAVFDGVAQIDTNGIPYALFSVVGVTVYSFLALCLTQGVRAFQKERVVIRNVPCPRVSFPTAAVLTALPTLGLMALASLATAVAVGRGLPLQVLALPLVLGWAVVFGWALVLVLATSNVRYRDVGAMVPFMLQGLLFLSPVAYPASEAPPTMRFVIELNPLTGLIEAGRWSILGSPLDPASVAVGLGWTALLLVAGWQLFTRLEVRFADII